MHDTKAITVQEDKNLNSMATSIQLMHCQVLLNIGLKPMDLGSTRPFPKTNVWRESRRLDRADGRLWVSLSQNLFPI
ncbi:hypothetical protein NHF48_023930 [Sphingomonas sp. H160509]|uniref:hypothetical protein n=1 Tax=Sphingomonas sp. H160509 TaxID=2955313 RepID=UPI002097F1B6|nr:hypothetical protein [Sphingomonas sp. H160509]MDD1453307.1 hypothetical protein [Sphingomonas sp. H160509]